MRLQLRPYQLDALARIGAAEERGVRSQLGVAATGLGKTVMFCALAEQRGTRTLILAHRDELIEQAAAKVLEVWPGADVGVVKAERNEVRAQVVVASVQTLSRPKRLAELRAPWETSTLLGKADPFGLVVVDEAHHAAADSYRAIIDALRAGQPESCICGHVADDHFSEEVHSWGEAEPISTLTGCRGCACSRLSAPLPAGPLLLGVTATPDRGDGRGLDDLFAEITFAYDLLWGIRSGYLCDLRGVRVALERLDLSSVKMSRGDYQAGDAGRALEDAGAPEMIVAAWLEHALGRRTLVFTPTVALAVEVADEFTRAGVKAGWVSGETPMIERRRILAAYSAGEIDVLANCAVLTEGYDEPRTDCIIVARPTKSRALYTQMVGRGTRRHPDKGDCLVLDVVGASAEHSLVTIPSLFGIEKPERVWTEGESLIGAVDLQERELVAAGRLLAEEVELFARLRTSIAWVHTHAGSQPRRYVCGLGSERPTVELIQLNAGDEESYQARILPWVPKGGKPESPRVLCADVSLELAQGMAEDFARKHGVEALVNPEAGWRKRPPSPKQLAAAGKWRLPNVAEHQTAGELSDALTAHIERKKAAKRAPSR